MRMMAKIIQRQKAIILQNGQHAMEKKNRAMEQDTCMTKTQERAQAVRAHSRDQGGPRHAGKPCTDDEALAALQVGPAGDTSLGRRAGDSAKRVLMTSLMRSASASGRRALSGRRRGRWSVPAALQDSPETPGAMRCGTRLDATRSM
mmetsp:Transcript_91294/g.257397  ORF Transcript_91294/g.257397 Transcript_91294/m.257397 type:complete len:147 (+) Transcript_91294:146-586(+)